MTLARGHHFIAMPGPSAMPARVLSAMHRDAPNIYEGDLLDLTANLTERLKTVACTAHDVAIYIANGHGAWEAALSNVLAEGDKVLCLATGRFAPGWAEMARRLGGNVITEDFGGRAAVDPARVEAALRAEPGIRQILVVQTDTASSVTNDIPAVRAAIDAAQSSALLMVDCIASLACEEFHMDDWGVDVMVAGCQKGLMTPPGVSFVYAGPKAREARGRAGHATPYWDWNPRFEPDDFYQHFGGTAPCHHLFGLQEALTMIFEEGLEQVWARHRTLGGAVHAAVESWAAAGPWSLNIADPGSRSSAVTAIRAGRLDANALRHFAEHELGVTLGMPLSLDGASSAAKPEGLFRIGHMGHVNPPTLLGTLGAIETAMEALDMPRGAGAIEAAARVIAAHGMVSARAAQ